MKTISLALAMLPLAACAATSTADTEPKLGTREARDLAKAIAGKEPGKPVSCVTSYNAQDLRVLGDNTLVLRVNRDLVYRNTLQGVCHGLSMGDTLVLNRTTSQYCRGDIAHVVNLPSGMPGGSCALGDFVPYRTAGK